MDRAFTESHVQARLRAYIPGSARLIWRAPREGAVLTFDDGPDPVGTPPVLDVLDDAGITATFFLLVERAESSPELVSRIVSAGHDVALHADRHERLDRIPVRALTKRLVGACSRLEQLAGTKVAHHRPPFGRLSWRGLQAARRAALDVVLWSQSPRDWESIPGTTLEERIVACARPGAIILLHDGAGPQPEQGVLTAAALEGALRRREVDGITWLRVSDL